MHSSLLELHLIAEMLYAYKCLQGIYFANTLWWFCDFFSQSLTLSEDSANHVGYHVG